MPGQTAIIGKGESVQHVLADRARLKHALRPDRKVDLPPEKRSALEARLAEVEQQLREIKEAIGEL